MVRFLHFCSEAVFSCVFLSSSHWGCTKSYLCIFLFFSFFLARLGLAVGKEGFFSSSS